MPNGIELQIRSSIIGRPGRARISEECFSELEIGGQGDLIIVERETKTVLLEAYSDILVEDGYIRVRWNDLNRLAAVEHDTVHIYPYKPLTRKIRKRVKKIIT